MAVRAEHHALLELGDDSFPPAGYPVLTDPKPLVRTVQLVEVEDGGGPRHVAHVAMTAHVLDRAELEPATEVDNRPALARRVLGRMTDAVAVRAEHVAFLGLGEEII